MSEDTPLAVADAAAPDAGGSPLPVESVDAGASAAAAPVEATPAADAAPVNDSILAAPEPDKAIEAADKSAELAEQVNTDAETKEPDQDAPLPSYEALALPDGVVIADQERFDERMSNFDGKLGELERKYSIDHEAAQAFRNEATGLAIQEITRVMQQAQERIAAAEAAPAQQFADRKQAWRTEFEDSDMAGNRRQTTLDRAESAIREYAGDEKAFRAALQETGMANHPAMIRLLSSVGEALVEGRMIAARGPASTPKTKAVKFYGT